jgi:hypothetical protein
MAVLARDTPQPSREHEAHGHGSGCGGLARSRPCCGHPALAPVDLDTDGVANYRMYPDWLQECQQLAGRAIMSDMVGSITAARRGRGGVGTPVTRPPRRWCGLSDDR